MIYELPTLPYDYAAQTVVANKKLAAGFTKAEDFNRSDVTVATRLGSTAVNTIKRYMPKAQVRLFDEEAPAIQELLNGKVYAYVGGAPMPANTAAKYPDTVFMINQDLDKELIGFGVRKGDFDTMNFFNNWITRMEWEGWLEERHQYWFAGNEWKKLTQ